MSNLTPTFLLLSLTLVIWSISAGLSGYLAGGYAREHGGAAAAGPVRGNLKPQLASLKKKSEEQAEDADVQLEYAYALMQTAYQESSSELLMQSVQQFTRVLDLEPERPEALLGLAMLCFEAGILDKSIGYYKRYIAVRPNDLGARSDYALTLVQAGEMDSALSELDRVDSEQAHFFPAMMTRAFALSKQGKIEEARKQAEHAKKHASSDEVIAEVDAFIARLDNPEAASPSATVNTAAGGATTSGAPLVNSNSPASLISSYFQGHQIVGPKIQSISWASASEVRIALKNFPVDQMPPFAKQKFLANVKENLASIPEAIVIKLTDDATGAELLAIEVGGSKDTAKAEING